MTSLLLSGYLALSKGRRISSENPNTRKTTQHMYYDTIIQTSGVDVPAELRFWVPATEQPLPDGTVADVLAKVYSPPNAKVLLDVIHFFPFPGDPTGATYEDNIPERSFPTINVIGHTVGAAETMDDGVSLGYPVQASEYVRDQSKTSRVYCRFDGTKARWKKTPKPSPGAAVFVVGVAYGVHLATGDLMVDVDQLQLNVGTSSVASSSAPRAENGAPAAKRRRFPTAASTTVAAAAASKAEASSSQRPNEPAEDVALDPAAVDASTEASVSSVESAPKKKAVSTRRRPLRRDENEEGEE